MRRAGNNDLEIRISILCDDCGSDLCVNVDSDCYGLNTIRVPPCLKCMEKAHQEGKEEEAGR